MKSNDLTKQFAKKLTPSFGWFHFGTVLLKHKSATDNDRSKRVFEFSV